MSHDALDGYLATLAKAEGSDLHVKVGSPPRIRVNGVLRRIEGAPDIRPADTVEMVKAIMRPDVHERFDRRADSDFAYSLPGVGRFRANAFRQRGSVAMIFRLVRTSAASFDDLGLPDVVARLALEHRGLVLVTGPTGSGKTTTLAAMIDHINQTRECHIITIEDPIEVLHNDRSASINQREIGVDAEDFSTAMRAAMRQDPDVILVGEMRDEETVSAALSAARPVTSCSRRSTPSTPPRRSTASSTSSRRTSRTRSGWRLAGASRAPCASGSSDRRRRGQGGGARDHGRQRADPAVHPRPVADRRPARHHRRRRVLRHADLRPGADPAARGGTIDMRGAMAAASHPHDLKVMLQQRGMLGPTRTVQPATA
jgi:twitching motility protein PilT